MICCPSSMMGSGWTPEIYEIELGDRDDIVFYAVVMEKRKETETYLVTGNMRHFPKETFVVTPREMIDIIEEGRRKEQK